MRTGSAFGPRSLSECFGEASRMARKPYLDKALRTGQRLSHERESDRGGRNRHLRSTYVPDVASDGTVVGHYELTMDRRLMQRLHSFLRGQ